MLKQLHYVIPCALLVAMGSVSIQAHAAADDEQSASVEKKVKRHKPKAPKPVMEAYYPAAPAVVPAPSYIVPPAPRRPYDWTGAYVGGFGGASADDRGTNFAVPTYGNLQGNDIGFGPSTQGNSYNVDSQTYNNLANGANSNAGAPGALNGPFVPGYTTYTQTATAQGYNTNAGNTAVGLNPVVTSNNGPIVGVNANVNVTPYNNLTGDRSDSQLTQRDNTRRLLGMLGGEIGYRKQFGIFVIGVEADGAILDGKRNDTANSTGQFSNNQGANGTAQAGECFGGNGAGGCGSAGINNSTGNVNVANNGNSTFTQSVNAGPKWLGTARLSAGFSVDRVLLYATGGLAYGQSDLAVSATYRDAANSTCSGTPSGFTNGSVAGFTAVNYSCNGVGNAGSSFTYSNAAQYNGYRSKLMTGIAVGGGAAYAMTDNIIFKLEGFYYDLGSISTVVQGSGSQTLTVNSGAGPAGVAPGTRTASVTPFAVTRTVSGFLGKVGIAYKFSTGVPDPIIVPAAEPIYARY